MGAGVRGTGSREQGGKGKSKSKEAVCRARADGKSGGQRPAGSSRGNMGGEGESRARPRRTLLPSMRLKWQLPRATV